MKKPFEEYLTAGGMVRMQVALITLSGDYKVLARQIETELSNITRPRAGRGISKDQVAALKNSTISQKEAALLKMLELSEKSTHNAERSS